MKCKYYFCILWIFFMSGCAILEGAGDVGYIVGKTGWGIVKGTGWVISTGVKKLTQPDAVQKNPPAPKVRWIGKKAIIPMKKEGASYFVDVKLEGKTSATFLLDTGASVVQISKAMAKKLNIKTVQGLTIPVQIAGGHMVPGRPVILKKVDVSGVVVENVKAVVLETDQMTLKEGLLGMSFLENFIFSIDTQKSQLILERR